MGGGGGDDDISSPLRTRIQSGNPNFQLGNKPSCISPQKPLGSPGEGNEDRKGLILELAPGEGRNLEGARAR